MVKNPGVVTVSSSWFHFAPLRSRSPLSLSLSVWSQQFSSVLRSRARGKRECICDPMLSSRLAARHPHDVSSSLLPFHRTRDVIFLAAAHGYFRVVRTSCNLRIISNRVLRFSTQRWLFFVGQVAQYIVGSSRVEKMTSLRGKSAASLLLCFIRKIVTQFISPEKREGATLH